MNGSEATQLTLVSHVTVTTLQMLYIQIPFILPIFILYRTYFFNGCRVISNSNVIPTQTVQDFGHNVNVSGQKTPPSGL